MCRKKNVALSVVLIVAGGWGLACCHAEPVDADRSLTFSGKPPAEDDTLVLVYASGPATLNPVTSSDSMSEAFRRHVYEPLADRCFEDPEKWEHQLAESVDFDQATNTFTIQLRKGVYWHPMSLPGGTPLPKTEFTAGDVIFTFQCILNEHVDAAHMRAFYLRAATGEVKNVISFRKLSRYEVEFRWLDPYFLCKEFTLAVPIIPRHVFSVDAEGKPLTDDFQHSREFAVAFNDHWANHRMCGTGPMKFESWERGRRFRLTRNDDYWGHPYFFSRIEYRCIPDANEAQAKLLAGEVDYVGFPDKRRYLDLMARDQESTKHLRFAAHDYPGYRYLGYNFRNLLFTDKRVRWAISHATPVDAIIEECLMGLAERANGPFPPDSPSSDDDLPLVKFDLKKARRLLDQAGWQDEDGDGVREKTIDGKRVQARFELMVFAESPTYADIGKRIAKKCRRIGIQVEVKPTPWPLMLTKLRKKEFDATILGWALPYRSDPYQIWHGSQAVAMDSSNTIGYRNEKVDRWIEQLRTATDESKQAELYQAVHREIHRDQPYTFLFREKRCVGYNKRIKNVKFYQIRPCVDPSRWYADEPRIVK
jgi:peptide/nickel transport system substrate-binding protein